MAAAAPDLAANTHQFGPVLVVEPQTQHTHTAILLHGRGSAGDEFMGELLETKCSNGLNLADSLPSWRLVFPSSHELWSTAFQEDMPAWFEAHSLTDPTARQDLQIGGIQQSVDYLSDIVVDEIARLGGAAGKVVLGGISQGAAVGLWTLLCSSRAVERPLGGFVGVSSWLPLAEHIGRYLREGQGTAGSGSKVQAAAFVENMMSRPRAVASTPSVSSTGSILSTPVFLGHGADDAYVDVELGQQAKAVLEQAGMRVQWKQYSGAEQEGHWLKEPEELDDIVEFLGRVS